ncbi:Beta-lactamase [Rhodospirillales bacterium URHD0017]|nr:Beta-lactamase [Rhodospirillales bacterium URHD0017]
MIAHVLVREGAVVTSTGDTADVPWWSFGKTVIATAALTLVRDGRLTLDERLPDRPYTLRRLLQHRAGLTEYGRLPAYHGAVERNEDAWSADEMLARTAADRLVYEPGKGWGHSTSPASASPPIARTILPTTIRAGSITDCWSARCSSQHCFCSAC